MLWVWSGVSVLALAGFAVASTSPPTSARTDTLAPAPQAQFTAGPVPGPAPDDLSALSPAADAIPPVAERIKSLGSGRGLAGLVTDYPTRSISVYWSGDLPADVREYVESRPLGVQVHIAAAARYSRTELESGRSRLTSDPIARSLGIVAISTPFDGHGLVVRTTRATLDATSVAALRAVSGIDVVDVRLEARESVGYANRHDDSAPWKGGIRIRHASTTGSTSCSAAFAVIVGGTGRLLGARHCDPSGNRIVRDGAGTSISGGGTAVQQKATIDSLLIDPTASPATTPRVYRGSWTSGTSSVVKNWYSNWPGDPVCTSGASTGEHCGSVYDDGQQIFFGGVWVNVIQAKAPSGSIMGGEGDSGAAMFKTVTGGVQARGVLLGPDADFAETSSCGTVDPEVAPITCSRYINYVPLSTILNTWGASLEVG